MVILLTPRLRLRPYVWDDLDDVVVIQGDADALRFEPWGPHDRDAAALALERVIAANARADNRNLDHAIERLSDGRVIGGTVLSLPPTGRRGWATLGYMLARDAWGQGYATEAAQAVVAHARSLAGIQGVRAISDSQNAASTKVLERCGLVCVGMVAELEPVKGRFRDMLKYELKF